MTKISSFIFIWLLLISSAASATTLSPFLAFSDLTNGPSEGLNDGKGSGTIVTIWGQNLGDSYIPNANKIEFIDSKGTVHEPVIYYWKRADGTGDSGPANLYATHKMQEIAFSIPKCPDGLGYIKVTNKSESDKLPFTVRPGSIYHVKSTGSNDTGDGSWDKPWQTVSQDTLGAFKHVPAGSIVYVHGGVIDEDVTDTNNRRGIYLSGRTSSIDNQTALVAYPGATPRPIARAVSNGTQNARVFDFYKANAVVISKYTVLGGNFDEPDPSSTTILKGTTGSGIKTTAYGRAVGNLIKEEEKKCVTGVAGAVVGGASGGDDAISGYKMLGNHILDWGCNQSSHFGHTTYFTNRSGTGLEVSAWEMGWNYLQDNKSKYGLHNYDQPLNGSCSDVKGTITVHDNVVVNQKGAGITFQGGEPDTATDDTPGICWTANFVAYNNILYNVGLGPRDENGVSSTAIMLGDSGMSGTVYLFHNMIYNWSDEWRNGGDYAIGFSDFKGKMALKLFNNIIYSDQDSPYHNFDDAILGNTKATNNLWYFSGSDGKNIIAPNWDNNTTTSFPEIEKEGDTFIFSLKSNSLAIAKGDTLLCEEVKALGIPCIKRDLYGLEQQPTPDLGAVKLAPPSSGPAK